MTEKKKPGNHRKQPLRDQQTQRKYYNRLVIKNLAKVIVVGLILWFAYPIVTNIHLPKWLTPKPHPADAIEEKPEPYSLEYNFYSLLPQEKIVAPQAFILSNNKKLMVQVASFKTKHSAEKLTKKLQKLGFKPVYYDSIHNSKGKWFRVQIGPLDRLNTATQYQNKLRLNGIQKSVIKTIPNNN